MTIIRSALTNIKDYSYSTVKSIHDRLPAKESVIATGAAALNATKNIGLTVLQGAKHLVTHPLDATAQGVATLKTAKAWATPAEHIPLALKPARPDPLKDLPLWELRGESDKQLKVFVRTTTAFATIKTVYEFICGMGTATNPEFYNVLLDGTSALSDKEFHAKIQKRFFPWIDETSNNVFIKLFARLCFVLMIPIMENISNLISSRIFADVRDSIDIDAVNNCENIGNRNIANINGYLKELCDIYEKLKTSPEKGKIDPIIENTLKARLKELATEAGVEKETFTQTDLNELFVKKLLAAYPYTLTLDEMVESFLDHIKFSKDSVFRIFNPILRLAIFIVSWIAWTLLHYPQKVANRVLAHTLKQVVIQTDAIGAVMGGVADSVRAPKFQHTLHTNLFDLMNDLGHTLQNPSESTPEPTVQLRNMDRLVKKVFDLLGVSQVENIEELQKLAAGKPPYTPLFLEGTINDAIVNAVTKLVPNAYELLVEPRQLEKIFLTSLKSLNTIYDVPPKPPSSEEIKAAEKEVIALKDQLISFIVRDVLKTLASDQVAGLKKETWWANLCPNFVPRIVDWTLNLNGPQKLLHDQVHAIVKRRTDAIFNSFLLKHYHYNEGVNRLVLFPFIRSRIGQRT